MLQTRDCRNLWFQGRSHFKGWTRGGRYLCRYRWVRRAVWSFLQTVPIRDRGVRAGVVIVSVCTKPLCVLVWPVPRPAVFSRHPAADPDHGSAQGRPLHGDVCARRIELNAATWERSCEGTNTMQEVSTATESEARDIIVFIVETRNAAWSVANSLMPTCFRHHNAAYSLRTELTKCPN